MKMTETLGCGRSSPKCSTAKFLPTRGTSSKNSLRTSSTKASTSRSWAQSNMKNKMMPLWDKMMLRKLYIIECINELLKNKANLVHSRHRSVHNFLMNLCAALAAYCFFENKPEALPMRIEKTRQLELF